MQAQAQKTRSQDLADQIAHAVLSGIFAPGFRLDEQSMAERFGVSRTPVREALRQLVATGLVEIRPRRGACVVQVDRDKLETLFVAMGEMEATCARLAAMSMSPIERRRLAHFHEAMQALAEREDRQGFAEANLTFHALIYAGSHNTVLDEMTTGIRRRLLPYRRAQFHASGRLAQSQNEHGAVVAAILAGDPAAAHAAMIHHMTLVESAFEEFAGFSLDP